MIILENTIDELNWMPIKEAIPHIFQRGLVFVTPDTPLWNTTLLLVPLHQLFARGIVVLEENKPIGRIGPKQILKKFLEQDYPKCMEAKTSNVMIEIGKLIDERSPINDVLKVFKQSNFAFVPVEKNEHVVATVSTRDFLPLVSKMEIDFPVSALASKLIFVSEEISIRSALTIMFEKNIRKIAIEESKEFHVIDQRSILDFLVNWAKAKSDLLSTSIKVLKKSAMLEINSDVGISYVAKKAYG